MPAVLLDYRPFGMLRVAVAAVVAQGALGRLAPMAWQTLRHPVNADWDNDGFHVLPCAEPASWPAMNAHQRRLIRYGC